MSKVAEMVKTGKFPYVTVVLIALNIAYFVILFIQGNPGNPAFMRAMGANCTIDVFEGHEYWRLLTNIFMHFSFQHLAGNMVYLGIVGAGYEPVVGHLKFLLIYILSGFGGSVVSAAWHQLSGKQYTVSAGASGAVYGIIAIVIYLTFLSRRRLGSSVMFWRIGIMVVFLFYSNFATGSDVDAAAHIGGLFFGLLLCVLLLPANKNKKSYRRKK